MIISSLGATTAKNYLKAGISAKLKPSSSKSKSHETFLSRICDALRDLVPFVQF